MAFQLRTFANDIKILGDLSIGGIFNLGFTNLAGSIRTIQTLGSATDIRLDITPKGTGTIRVPSAYISRILDNNDVINKEYADKRIAGKELSTELQAPGAPQNNYAITWDNTAGKFTLAAAASTKTFASGIEDVSNVVKLGGTPLDRHTDIVGAAFNLRLGTTAIKLSNIELNAVTKIEAIGGTSRLTLNGTNPVEIVGGAALSSIIFNAGGAITLTDSQVGTGQRGLRGAANYSANLTANDYGQKVYIDGHIGGKLVSPLITGPTISENNWLIKWDQANNRYTLGPSSAATGTIKKEQQFLSDGTTGVFTVTNGVIDQLDFVEVNGVVQQQGVHFDRVLQDIDFDVALTAGDTITIHYFEGLLLGNAGHTIQYNGSSLTDRDNLDFRNGIIAQDTGVSTLVELGGSFSRNTTILGGGFTLDIGTPGSRLSQFQMYTSGYINLESANSIYTTSQSTNEMTGSTIYINSTVGSITLSAFDFTNGHIRLNAGKDIDFRPGTTGVFKLKNIPAPNPATYFFRGDGTWAIPAGTTAALTSGSAITVAGSTINWGGPLTGNADVTGGYVVNLGTSASKITSLYSEVTNDIQFKLGATRFGLILGIGTVLDLGSDAIGDMYYRGPGNILTRLGLGTADQVIKSNGTIPQWGTSATTTNIYNTDGTLTGNRVLTGASFNLSFTGLKAFSLDNALVATANDQELIAITGTSSFTPGAFTGVTQTAFKLLVGATPVFKVRSDGGIVAGSSAITANFNFGVGTINNGAWGAIVGGLDSIINAGVGSALAVGESVLIRRYGSVAFGRSTRVNASAPMSFVGGGWIDTGTDPNTNEKVTQVGGFMSFGFYGTNDSQTAGHGSLGNFSAILGGINHNIPADSSNVVILGGSAIKARAADSNQVYVPNFNIVLTPAFGVGADNVLVRDGTTGLIKVVTQASLGGAGGGTGTVTSVSGTTDRITITGVPTINPTVDIAATYAGQASIVTLGTVTTGVWNATTIGIAKGGTGLTAIGSANQMLGVNAGGSALEYKTLALGSTAQSNNLGIVHAANLITLHVPDASASDRGVVNTGAQTFAGGKTFSATPTFSTMTIGSVLYAGTAGLLSQDNTNFKWDATNKTVLIGAVPNVASIAANKLIIGGGTGAINYAAVDILGNIGTTVVVAIKNQNAGQGAGFEAFNESTSHAKLLITGSGAAGQARLQAFGSGGLAVYSSQATGAAPITFLVNIVEKFRIMDVGLGVAGVTSPTAKLHIAAHTTTAGSAPLKFISGTAMTTPEDGAFEYHTSHLYFTIGSTRYQLDQQGGGGGGLTSVGLLTGVSGADVNVTGSPLVANGNITLNIPDAGNTARGLVTTTAQTFAGTKTFTNIVVTTLGAGNTIITTPAGSGPIIATTVKANNEGIGIGGVNATGEQSVYIAKPYLLPSGVFVLNNDNTNASAARVTVSNGVNLGYIDMNSTVFVGGGNKFTIFSATPSGMWITASHATTGFIALTTATTERARLTNTGLGIGQSSPTARLHIAAHTATANTAPIKLTTGTAMTTPEDGAFEYHTSHLYFTIGSTRYQLDQQGGGGGAPGGVNTELQRNNAGAFGGAKIFTAADGNIAFGDSATVANTRILSVAGSLTDVSMSLRGKGAGSISFYPDAANGNASSLFITKPNSGGGIAGIEYFTDVTPTVQVLTLRGTAQSDFFEVNFTSTRVTLHGGTQAASGSSKIFHIAGAPALGTKVGSQLELSGGDSAIAATIAGAVTLRGGDNTGTTSTGGAVVIRSGTGTSNSGSITVDPLAGELHLGNTTGKIRIILGSDATGDIYYRNSTGYVTRLGVGTNTHVLTLVAGLPTWAAPTGGGSTSPAGANTEIQINNAGVFGAGKIFIPSNGDLSFGDTGLAGATRTLTAIGSASNIVLTLVSKGLAQVEFRNTSAGSHVLYASSSTGKFGNIKVTGQDCITGIVAAGGISGTTNGDDIGITAGANFAGSAGNGGDISITGGGTTGTGIGGDVAITGGPASGAQGGHIIITSGNGITDGNLTLDALTGELNFNASVWKLKGVVAGTPLTMFFRGDGTWAVPAGGGGGSPGGINTEIQINASGAFGGGKVYVPTNGNITLGDSSTSGDRTISAVNSISNATLILKTQNGGYVFDAANLTTFRPNSTSNCLIFEFGAVGVTNTPGYNFKTGNGTVGNSFNGSSGTQYLMNYAGNATNQTGTAAFVMHNTILSVGSRTATGEIYYANYGLSSGGDEFRIKKGGILQFLTSVVPSADPPAGTGYLYIESGALKYRGPSGTITTIAVA